MTSKKRLTQKRLRELLKYYPISGLFVWIKKRAGKAKKGVVAGSLHSTGYVHIKVDGKTYKAHRLAFLYMLGFFPFPETDHKNRIKDDNRWINIRAAGRSCNVINSGIRKDNTTGVCGVFWCNRSKKWTTQITVKKKRKHVGYFDSFFNAVKARYAAEKKYGYSDFNLASSSFIYLKENAPKLLKKEKH